jgi:hypothetical protein
LKDDGKLPAESDQATLLSENGYGLEPAAGRKTIMQVVDLEMHLYSWTFEPEPA